MNTLSNEWIKWNGGECPVSDGTIVDIRYRDGEVLLNKSTPSFIWKHGKEKHPADIIEYRLSQQKQVEQSVIAWEYDEYVDYQDCKGYWTKTIFHNRLDPSEIGLDRGSVENRKSITDPRYLNERELCYKAQLSAAQSESTGEAVAYVHPDSIDELKDVGRTYVYKSTGKNMLPLYTHPATGTDALVKDKARLIAALEDADELILTTLCALTSFSKENEFLERKSEAYKSLITELKAK